MTSDRSTLFAFGIVLLVGLLAIGVWAVSLLADGESLAVSATATPTKTPGINANARPGTGFNLSKAPLPTLTPTPGPATPTPAAQSASTPDANDALMARLSDIARAYGLNPAGDYIIVDQDAQEMYIVESGELLRQINVTTGDPEQGWDTPAWFGLVGDYWGTFQGAGGVMADEGWWLFQRGGNFLIHGLPYTLDENGEKHYVGMDDLGAAPASHGCIRLSPDDASWFSQWNPQGRPIIILPLSGQETVTE